MAVAVLLLLLPVFLQRIRPSAKPPPSPSLFPRSRGIPLDPAFLALSAPCETYLVSVLWLGGRRCLAVAAWRGSVKLRLRRVRGLPVRRLLVRRLSVAVLPVLVSLPLLSLSVCLSVCLPEWTLLTGTAVVVVLRILPGCSRAAAAAAVAGRSPAGGRPGTLLDSRTCSTVRTTLEPAKKAKGRRLEADSGEREEDREELEGKVRRRRRWRGAARGSAPT